MTSIGVAQWLARRAVDTAVTGLNPVLRSRSILGLAPGVVEVAFIILYIFYTVGNYCKKMKKKNALAA